MQWLSLGTAVLNQTPLDWDGNQDRILQAIAAARAAGVTVLCLPELCITGYGCEDAFLAANTRRQAWRVLHAVLPATHGMIVCVGLPLLYQNALYNTAALLVDGRIAGFAAKQHLAGDGIHYEPRWFKPWPAELQTRFSASDLEDYTQVSADAAENARTTGEPAGYPLGDLLFDIGGVRIGFEICEDAWVANRPGARHALRGADVILNPSASHFAFGKDEIRQRFVLEGSRAFGVSYLYANLLGNEAGRAIYDGGAMIASGGKMLAIGPQFSFADMRLTAAYADLDATRQSRAASGSYQPQLRLDDDDCVRAPFDWPRLAVPRPAVIPPLPWPNAVDKEEEFTHALTLGLFDYLRKSRSRGFVISLSGGADSSALACLVGLMARLGVRELGHAGFVQKLAYVPGIEQCATTADLTKKLLTCVYQATQNSGPVTLEAARRVAAAVGANFLLFDVDPVVRQYIALVEEGLGRTLTWQTDDIALQNIQARVRSPSVWLVANLQNALLLATSNRSEAAVGYATMDGDTSGGLSPLAGIDKHFLRHWLRWLESSGPVGAGPIPELRYVNQQAPTAELRPPEQAQTDEGDLMPYDLLDAIEKAAIRDKRNPLETFLCVEGPFAQYDRRQLAAWVERFFRLWCRNQWKRERYAPSFHLDDENLDPKTWCRFPILNGGFEAGLRELDSQ
ncbi:MAG: NAD(+) synthase [Pirellulales bacterium]|nr:NAD(+) synthase [Pirellulales bacterium]